MARPTRCRKVCTIPDYDCFKPKDIELCETINLTLDEYEVIRLIDLEKLTHEQCARQMEISRTTVTEIYSIARYKIADSLVNGKTLSISGGNYKLCNGINKGCHKRCKRLNVSMKRKDEKQMRIAVTYNQGEVFQHFGHTTQFKIFDIENNEIVSSEIVDTNGQGHGALASLLVNGQVDVLICGGIGAGAQNALANAGITLYGGVSGQVDQVIKSFIEGTLVQNTNVQCSHHEHNHSCGEHQCHEDKHGCTGSH